MRILVVDDHPIILEIIGNALVKPGVTVDRAKNCSDAYALLEENEYDWATLDMSLPDGSGIDILRQIHSQHPGTRVIIISMEADSPVRNRKLLSLGADKTFPKPFNLHELVEYVYGNSEIK